MELLLKFKVYLALAENFYEILKHEWKSNNKYEQQFFSCSDICLIRIDFSPRVTPNKLITLSSVMLLKQIMNCSSSNLCCADIWFVGITINFVLLILNSMLVSIEHFAMESILFSSSLMHVSYSFNFQLDWITCIQVFFVWCDVWHANYTDTEQ